VVGDETQVSELTTTVKHTADSHTVTNLLPDAQCFFGRVHQSVYTDHYNEENSEQYAHDPNPPKFLTIEQSQDGNGTPQMNFPITHDPRAWVLVGQSHYTATLCDDTQADVTEPFRSDWWPGTYEWQKELVPEGFRAPLVSEDNGATYKLRVTKTKQLPPNTPDFTIPQIQVYNADITITRVGDFNILSPADGAQLNRHMPEVEVTPPIEFAWESLAGAQKYKVTLLDKNTGTYLLQDKNMHLSTSFSKPIKQFAWGHEYEFTAKAITGTGELEDTVTFKLKPLPDITDPLAQSMESGATVIWENCTPELIAARDALVTALQAENWTIQYRSAYRPLQYQEHLYLIVHNLEDNALSAADRALLEQQKTAHGLGSQVAKPNTQAPHTRGEAFDANVYDEHGQALNSLSFMDSRLLKLAKEAGFKKPPTGDNVHFQLAN
jgi:hypothetical protein